MKNHFSRIVGIVVAACVMFSAVAPLIATAAVNDSDTEIFVFKEDFEKYEEGAQPQGFNITGEGGSVMVQKNHLGSKSVQLQNNSEGTYLVMSRSFDGIKNKNLTLKLDFSCFKSRNDGYVLAEIGGSDGLAFSIETKDGGIYAKKSYGRYDMLLENYLLNKQYSFEIEIDMQTKTYSVTLNGSKVLKKAELLNTCEDVNVYRAYTYSSPGFCIDNLSLSYKRQVEGIKIRGVSQLTIPDSGEKTAEYIAEVFDANSEIYKEAAIDWSIEGETYGASVVPTGINSARLVIDSSALRDSTVALKAIMHDNPAVFQIYNVALIAPVETRMEITGPMMITSKNEAQNDYEYRALIYDQQDNPLTYTDVKWAIEGEEIPNSVSIGEYSGVLHVNGEVPKDKFLEVVAVSENSNVQARFKVVMLDFATYLADNARLELVRSYVDRMLDVASDKWNGTPLLADGINIGSGQPYVWVFPDEYDHDPAVVSDLTNQTWFLMTMNALSDLTGDGKYKKRVYDIYEYMLNNYQANNGMMYWGGHAGVDLLTNTPLLSPSDYNIHELKWEVPLWDVMFEIDPEKASNAVKGFIGGHITDWSTLLFTRHGKYSTTPDLESWNNTSLYVENNHEPGKSRKDISFYPESLARACLAMYAHTGDEKAYFWGTRLYDKMIMLKNQETGMPAWMLSTAHNAPGVLDPMTTLEPIGHWWDMDPQPSHYTWATYGDRVYNQFAQPLVDDGFITKDQMDEILEHNLLLGTYEGMTGAGMLMSMVEHLEPSDPMYDYIVKNSIDMTAQWVKNAYYWDESRRGFKILFNNGVDITDATIRRTGYHGKAGNKLTQSGEKPWIAYELLLLYRISQQYSDLPDSQYLYDCARLIVKHLGYGEIGETEPGVNIQLNKNINNVDPVAMEIFLELYSITGNIEFLDMARDIGDDLIENYYNDGYFGEKDKENVKLGQPYSLLLLDLMSTIVGRSEIVPLYQAERNPQFQSVIQSERTWSPIKLSDFHSVYSWKNIGVNVKDLRVDVNEITLKRGETYKVKVDVLPNDANQAHNWLTSDATVARVDENDVIYAEQEGTVQLTCFSDADGRKRKIINVTVE